MKPIKFKDANVVFGAEQKEYMPCPAYKDQNGDVITCWSLTLKEKVYVIFTGKIFLSIKTFNKPLQPLLLLTSNPLKPKCRNCGTFMSKAMFMGFPMRLCDNRQCNSVRGFWIWILNIYFDGRMIVYYDYWPTLWDFLRGKI
jgi:hypothetical protein